MSQDPPILQVTDLVTSFQTEQGRVVAIDGVSFHVARGETLGIVGESGCGKSVTSLSVMRLLPKPAGTIDGGTVVFDGTDLGSLKAEEMHKVRGNRIAMIFQEPMTALNPVQRVGKQLGEIFDLHRPDMSRQEVLKECAGLLERVGIPEPEARLMEYPHQLSGGMRQRVMIAMALACKPDIIIADEPTTALDVTIQAQILDLMKELQRETGMAIVFITHDLGVIAEVCDRVLVMYAGKVVEEAGAEELFANPSHPYTKGLLESIPRLDAPRKVKLSTIEGQVPSLAEMPKGCRFANRCPLVVERCSDASPPLESAGEDHVVACYEWKREAPNG
jgi:oligopeptide/dipeptide ABC transporter ATP-binding protein